MSGGMNFAAMAALKAVRTGGNITSFGPPSPSSSRSNVAATSPRGSAAGAEQKDHQIVEGGRITFPNRNSTHAKKKFQNAVHMTIEELALANPPPKFKPITFPRRLNPVRPGIDLSDKRAVPDSALIDIMSGNSPSAAASRSNSDKSDPKMMDVGQVPYARAISSVCLKISVALVYIIVLALVGWVAYAVMSGSILTKDGALSIGITSMSDMLTAPTVYTPLSKPSYGWNQTFDAIEVINLSTLHGDVMAGNTGSNFTIGGNLVVRGTISTGTSSTASAGNQIDIVGALKTSSDANVGGQLSVSGNTIAGGDVQINGVATMRRDAYIQGVAVISRDLTVAGGATVTSNLAVTGTASITGSTTLAGTTASSITISGASVFQGTVSFAGALAAPSATFTSTLTIAGKNVYVIGQAGDGTLSMTKDGNSFMTVADAGDALALGANSASVAIGKAGATTTVLGPLSAAQVVLTSSSGVVTSGATALTLDVGAAAAVSIGATATAITLGAAATAVTISGPTTLQNNIVQSSTTTAFSISRAVGAAAAGTDTSVLGQTSTAAAGGRLILKAGDGSTSGGDVNLDVGASTGGGAAGSMTLGTSATQVTIGSSSQAVTIQSALTVKNSITLDSASALSIKRAAAAAGAGTLFSILGQNGAAGQVGGDLSLEPGTGTTAGAVTIGTTSSSVTVGGASSPVTITSTTFAVSASAAGGITLNAASISVGPNAASAVTISRPSMAASAGGALSIIGQPSTSADGGNIVLDGGAGSSTAGQVLIGTASSAVSISLASGSTTINSPLTVSGDLTLGISNTALLIRRNTLTAAGAGSALSIVGQNALGGNNNGGDIFIDSGKATGTGANGALLLGTQTSGPVSIGSTSATISIVGSFIGIGDTTNSLIVRRPVVVTGNAQSTIVEGQATDDVNGRGGDLSIVAGAGWDGGSGNMAISAGSCNTVAGACTPGDVTINAGVSNATSVGEGQVMIGNTAGTVFLGRYPSGATAAPSVILKSFFCAGASCFNPFAYHIVDTSLFPAVNGFGGLGTITPNFDAWIVAGNSIPIAHGLGNTPLYAGYSNLVSRILGVEVFFTSDAPAATAKARLYNALDYFTVIVDNTNVVMSRPSWIPQSAYTQFNGVGTGSNRMYFMLQIKILK